MYFSAAVDGVSHLWRQRFPDGAPEPLTSGSATEEEGVAVAPDGASLITSLGRRQSSVWMQDPRGERLLSAEGFAFDPSLSADGARVYYLLRRTGTPGTAELTMVDIASGRSDRLLPDFSGRAGSSGQALPDSPTDDRSGFEAWATLPGAEAAERDDFVPSADPATFAFTKADELRNLFRIPLSGR
jgi:Tol biopolymer transport system component